MKRIYVMRRSDGALKVGMSANPKRRAMDVARIIKQPVEVLFATELHPDPAQVEKWAHYWLHAQHDVGEWFWTTLEEAKSAIAKGVESTDRNLANTKFLEERNAVLDAQG